MDSCCLPNLWRSLCVSVVMFGLTAKLHAEIKLWETVVPQVSFTNTPVATVLDYIQSSSRKIDPSGRGIRILYNREWFGARKATMDLRGRSLRWLMTEGFGRRCVIIDDVALIFDHPCVPTHRIAAVFGACRDADTGEPVQSIRISTDWHDGEQACNTVVANDGEFVGYVTYGFVRPWLGGLGFLHENTYEKIDIIAEAPGYQKVKSTIYVGDHGAGHCQKRLELLLHKETGLGSGLLRWWYGLRPLNWSVVHGVWAVFTVIVLGLLGIQQKLLRRAQRKR